MLLVLILDLLLLQLINSNMQKTIKITALLIGHELAGRGGDRTLGAILGGAAGALLGRSIDRSSTRCG